MSVLARVAKCLETIAPLSLAEAWDNTGLLIEAPFPRPGASKIMLTIDLTNSVVDECLNDKQVSVVVAYHPPIFKKFNRLCLSDEKQAIALRIAAAGISVVSHHTAHDNVVGGVNDWLCKAFPPGVTKPMHPLASPPDGHEGAGGGRVHILAQPITLDDTIAHIKKHLVRVARAKELVKCIGVCAGSGSSVLTKPADCYVTGEMGHHDVLACVANGTSVILCEHSNTERGYLVELQTRLDSLLNKDPNFKKIDIVISKTDRDPLEIV